VKSRDAQGRSLSQRLSPDLTQIHSANYRNPAHVPAGEVLVVGAANSGVQITEELAATHRVRLCQGSRIPRLPRRLLGKPLHWWGDHLGLIAAPLDNRHGRTQRGDLLVGTGPRQLARRHGVELLPRAVDAHAHTVTFADGRALDAQTIIWATGHRPDYSWIHAPILDDHGLPIHQRDVTHSPGLYLPRLKTQ
jgi:putative flavoprotein involved in K+ transport